MNEHRAPFVKTAWILLISLVIGIAYLQTLPDQSETASERDVAGEVLSKMQGEIVLGMASTTGVEQSEIISLAQSLNAGSVGQRQRYMALMIALGDKEAANQASEQMYKELELLDRSLGDKQQHVQEELDTLILGGDIPSEGDFLTDQLGWFGTLLVADSKERESLNQIAELKVVVLSLFVLGIVILGTLGFIGIVICTAFIFSGKIKSSLQVLDFSEESRTSGKQPIRHGIYVEVFVLWLIVFLVFGILADPVADLILEDNTFVSMSMKLLTFFMSLIVLFWARIRGISGQIMRQDIGLTKGRGVFIECLFGLAGYAMMLPMLAVGLCFTFLLLWLQAMGSGVPDPFSGTGGGSHPIVVEIAEANIGVKTLLFILGAFAAPIVEEIMFRGVLYRQLRSVSVRFGLALSIIVSILVTSFLFAAIHPQGWVAIPALMSIAIGMNVMREWRGSLLPSMIVHGVSNGLIISLMLTFLS